LYLARFAVAKTTAKVAAAVYFPDGSITASKFNAQLLLCEQLGAAPASGTFRPIVGQTIPVFNVLDEEIDAGTMILAGQCVDEVWIVQCVY
jgi:hypothetical protein